MIAFLVVLLAGLAIGFSRGGSLTNLRGARLALLPLVFVSVGLQVAAQLVPRNATFVAFLMVLASYAVLFTWAGANWRVAGMFLLAIGAAMNFTVIIANQGMPISADAAARAGWTGPEVERLVLRGKHFISHGQPRLAPLGDVIPLGGAPAVASVGDLIAWSGLIVLLQDLMRGPRGRRTRVDPRDAYAHLPVGHVGATLGDVMLDEIDLRDRTAIPGLVDDTIDLRGEPSEHPLDLPEPDGRNLTN